MHWFFSFLCFTGQSLSVNTLFVCEGVTWADEDVWFSA